MSGGSRLLIPWYRYPPFRESGIGGLSVVVWELSRSLARSGLRVDVVTPGSSSLNQSEIIDAVGVLRSSVGTKLARGARLNAEETGLLSEYDAILSIANFAARSLKASPELTKLTSRQIHTIGLERSLSSYLSMKPSISDYIKMRYFKAREEREERTLRGTITICVSRYLLHAMLRNGLEEEQNLRLIPNGVDTHSFRPLKREKRFDLVFVGRFQRAKGLDVLLDAMLILDHRGVHATLAVVGEFGDGDRSHLLSRLPGHLRPRVSFLGTTPRESMPEVLNAARILAVPSRYESFGMPALEAISCGIPVVATAVGGLPEIVDPQVGLLVDPPEPAHFAEALSQGLRDDSMKESALANGPARAAAYDWSPLAARIREAILS